MKRLHACLALLPAALALALVCGSARALTFVPPNDGDLNTAYVPTSATLGEGLIINAAVSASQVTHIVLHADHSVLLVGSGFDSGNDFVGMVANIDASGTPVEGDYCHATGSCPLTGGYAIANAFVLPPSSPLGSGLFTAGAHAMAGSKTDFGFQIVDTLFNQTTPAIVAEHAYPQGLSGELIMTAAVAQTDGKFVFASARTVSSNTAIIVTRALADLSVDTTFGTNGSIGIAPTVIELGKNYSYIPQALVVAPDGKIVIAATTTGDVTAYNTSVGVFRLNTDGSLDTTFGPSSTGRLGFDFENGTYAKQQSIPHALALRDDGSILVGGSILIADQTGHTGDEQLAALTRLHADGSRGDTFGAGNNASTTDNSHTVANGSTVVLHYGSSSSVVGDTVYAISIQPNGRILLAGMAGVAGSTALDFGIARLEKNGDPDLSFGNISGTPGESTRYYSYLCGEGPTTVTFRCGISDDGARAITSDSSGIYVAGYSKSGNDIGFGYIRLINRDLIFANNFGELPPGG